MFVKSFFFGLREVLAIQYLFIVVVEGAAYQSIRLQHLPDSSREDRGMLVPVLHRWWYSRHTFRIPMLLASRREQRLHDRCTCQGDMIRCRIRLGRRHSSLYLYHLYTRFGYSNFACERLHLWHRQGRCIQKVQKWAKKPNFISPKPLTVEGSLISQNDRKAQVSIEVLYKKRFLDNRKSQFWGKGGQNLGKCSNSISPERLVV